MDSPSQFSACGMAAGRSGWKSACRRIVVEDIAVEDGEEPSFARRMVFVGNSNLIQSEACLRPTARAAACTNTSRTKSIAKSSKDHQSNTSDFPNLEIDHSVLTMEYHKHIVGGIISSKHCLAPLPLLIASALCAQCNLPACFKRQNHTCLGAAVSIAELCGHSLYLPVKHITPGKPHRISTCEEGPNALTVLTFVQALA